MNTIMFIPHYTNTSSHHEQKIRTVYRFANLTLSSDRTLTNTHFGLHFPEPHGSLTWVNQRGNCECRRTPAAHCTSPELLRHYQSTHFSPQTMASSAPRIIRLRLHWSNFPLLANSFYLPLPLIIRLQLLCLTFSNSLLSYHMICKTKALVHGQDTSNPPCNVRRKLG